MTLHELIDLIDNGEMDTAARIGPRIDEEIAAVVRAALDTGKAGKLAITISVGRGAGKRVLCNVALKTTIPQPASREVTLFADQAGSLHENDPQQARLPGLEPRRAKEPT